MARPMKFNEKVGAILAIVNQHRCWEIDIVYYEIRLLEMLGLASHVIRPRAERHAKRVQEETPNRAA